MSQSKPATVLEAIQQVLAEAKEPLNYREITRRALERQLVTTKAAAPEVSFNAQLSLSINEQGEASPFVRVSRGVFGLRAWTEEAEAGHEPGGRIFVAHYPVYAWTRAALRVWEGMSRDALTGMQVAIGGLRGNPQQTVDWSDPDEWITERLSGEDQRLALKIWEGSHKQVNPRYTMGYWSLASQYQLMVADAEGILRLTDRGREFIVNDAGETVREIDRSQGVLKILELVAEQGTAARADVLGPWREHVLAESRIRSDSAVTATLWSRLRNLMHRGFVQRAGRTYSTTQAGLAYLQQAGAAAPSGEPDMVQQIRQLLGEQQRKVREGLHELLAEMDPYAFEYLVKRLLEELGYEEVEVTAPSNDRGVDVVGQIELGITSVREVIQVKRHRGNIQRPVLDALRGVLHRFKAVRGTIITTGDFSRGTRDAAFELGAAPITLIDGEKLMELLIEHGLGVNKRPLELWELDPDGLLGGLGEEDEEA